jgi:hypothetical protein
MAQVGGEDRFCVHKLWWIRYVSNTYTTSFAVLCIAFLPYQDRKKEGILSQIKGQSFDIICTLGIGGILAVKKKNRGYSILATINLKYFSKSWSLGSQGP